MDLSGLGAVYPGYLAGRKAQANVRTDEAAAAQAEDEIGAQRTLGQFFQSLGAQPRAMPGAMPMPPMPGGPAPQPPMPGQPSIPMQQAPRAPVAASPRVWGDDEAQSAGLYPPGSSQPAQPGPGAAPMPGQASQPAGPQQPTEAPQPSPEQVKQVMAMPGGMQALQGKLDWRTVATMLVQSNPTAKPEWIAGAVTKLAPLMRADSVEQWKAVELQMQQMRHQESVRQFDTREKRLNDEAQYQRGRPDTPVNPDAAAMDAYLKANPGATPQQIAEYRQTLRTPSASSIRAADVERTKAGVLTGIDEAIEMLDAEIKGGPTVTGPMGMARRLGLEAIGEYTGISSKSPASLYETKINLLKNQIPRVLAGTSRTSKDERDKLDTILRGLSPTSQPKQARDALLQVKRTLELSSGGAGAEQPRATERPSGGKPIDAKVRSLAAGAMQRNGWTREQVIQTLQDQGYDTSGF